MSIEPGRIIWARLGPRGGYKKRPAVVISELEVDGSFFVVVGTTQRQGSCKDTEVELPWHRPRHPRTYLNRPTVVDCTWVQKLTSAEVEEEGGVVPDTCLVDILQKVEPHLPKP